MSNFQIIDIFGHTADTVSAARGCLEENQINGTAVINNVKPVANILAVAVDFDFLPDKEIGNQTRHKFFRVLVRTEVVAAVGYRYRNIESIKIRSDDVIRGGFGGSVGTVRVVRSSFIKLGVAVKRKGAKNFISRNMVEFFDAVFFGSLKKDLSTHDVGFGEN